MTYLASLLLIILSTSKINKLPSFKRCLNLLRFSLNIDNSYCEDISDIEVMSRLNDLKLKSEAAAEKRMGEQALRAGYLKAAMIGLQTAQDIMDSRKGSAESLASAKQSGSSYTLLQSPRPRYRPT